LFWACWLWVLHVTIFARAEFIASLRLVILIKISYFCLLVLLVELLMGKWNGQRRLVLCKCRLFSNHYRLFCNASNTVYDFVSLSLSSAGVAKQHELRHQADLLLADPINLFFVSIFSLELSKTLSHNDLVLLSKWRCHNLFHPIHHRLT
jgi:hypothetical protein